MTVQILDSAKDHLVEGYRFYEEQASGLGTYFLDSLFADIDSLAIYGGIHALCFGFHRSVARRFPFAIYYPCRMTGSGSTQCSKSYMDKEFVMPPGWEHVGKFWGVIGRKNLPRSKVMEVEISREAFVKVRRTARRWFGHRKG